METIDLKKIEMRGSFLGDLSKQMSEEELFQNQTLRPILKFQNEIFIASFKHYIESKKVKFSEFSADKKLLYIENTLHKDTNYSNVLKGIIIGLFTQEEFAIYIKNSSNLNKRMMNLLIERLKSQLQIFDN